MKDFPICITPSGDLIEADRASIHRRRRYAMPAKSSLRGTFGACDDATMALLGRRKRSRLVTIEISPRIMAADLSRSGLKYKEISDYGFGNKAVTTEAEARSAIAGAERFIGGVTARLRS